jgi:hypothetical protein
MNLRGIVSGGVAIMKSVSGRVLLLTYDDLRTFILYGRRPSPEKGE